MARPIGVKGCPTAATTAVLLVALLVPGTAVLQAVARVERANLWHLHQARARVVPGAAKVRPREVREALILPGATPTEGTGQLEAMGTGIAAGANIHGIEGDLAVVNGMEAPGRTEIVVPATGIVVVAMEPVARTVVVTLDLGKPTMLPMMSLQSASTWADWHTLQRLRM